MLTIIILILIALLGYTLFHQFNAFRQIQIRENHQRLFYATPVIIAIVFLEVGFVFGETFIQYGLFILIAINFVAIPFTSGLSKDFIYYKSNKRGLAGFIPKSKALTDVIGSQIEKEDDYFTVDFSFEKEIISLRFSNEQFDAVHQIISRT